MNAITPNPLLGVGWHAVGGGMAANCYTPQKYVKRWSWETYWLAQASWCWLLWPLIGAALTIPQLGQVLAEAPKDRMLMSFLMGVAYGIAAWRSMFPFVTSDFPSRIPSRWGSPAFWEPWCRRWSMDKFRRYFPERVQAGC